MTVKFLSLVLKFFCSDRNRHGGGVFMFVSLMFFASVVLPSPQALEILTLSVLFYSYKTYEP